MHAALVSRDTGLGLLTHAEVRQQLRVDVSDEDAGQLFYLQAAVEIAEGYLGRGLLTQTWRVVDDDFDDEVYLPMAAPLQSVTSVQYYNTSGTLTTLSSSTYVVETTSEPARLTLAPNHSWPAVQAGRVGAVVITYVVGWDDPDDVPAAIKQGVRLAMTSMYESRDGAEAAKTMEAAKACWALAGRVSHWGGS